MSATSDRTPQPQHGDAEREKEEAERRHREMALDNALEDTFPASDAIALLEPAPSKD